MRSNYHGVTAETSTERKRLWRARLKLLGNDTFLGYYSTEAQAAYARDVYVREHHLDTIPFPLRPYKINNPDNISEIEKELVYRFMLKTKKIPNKKPINRGGGWSPRGGWDNSDIPVMQDVRELA